MKNRFSDRFWIISILILIVVETLWLLTDMNIIEISFFRKKNSQKGEVEAGYVITISDELKRRNSNSLIWDPTKENDILYYNDSLLTLSQGSARLYLKDRTELQLSENTLITLEEPEEGSNSEIRLRFAKGDLKARNPFRKTKIQGEDWTVKVEKGSEISLRQDKGSYEFEVITGKAVLQTEKGESQSLNQTTILKLNSDQKIEKIEKSQNLQWFDKKPVRIYVYDEQAKVPVNWEGSARNININKVGEVEKKLSVPNDKQQTEVVLPIGSYALRLEDEKGLSGAKNIEVWKAPKIFLKKPLPRDRIKIGEETEFVWTSDNSLKEYRLKIGNEVFKTENNFKKYTFEKEEDFNWSVEGVDEQGYVVPAFYDSKIYFTEDPLAAPKLKKPTIRKNIKKNPNSSKFNWFHLLIQTSQAKKKTEKEKVEAMFEWEAVTGADVYFIEISSDPGFRQPEVIETIKGTHYVWKSYNPEKKYYWRVASGTKKGRLGRFSDPIEFEPAEVEETPNTEATQKPAVQTPKLIERQKSAESVKPPEPVKKTKVVTEQNKTVPENPIVKPEGWSLALTPYFNLTSAKGEQNVNVELVGPVLASFQVEYFKEDQHFLIKFGTETWKPKSISELPSQKNLNVMDLWLYYQLPNHGVSLHQSFIPQRESNSSITAATVLVLAYRYAFENFGFSIGSNGQVHELAADGVLKKYFNSDKTASKYYYGCGFNLFLSTHKDGSSVQGQINLLLGFDNF